MKKIIYTILICSLFIMPTKAFNIDIDKINVQNKNDKLIENLDKRYKIEAKDFKTSFYQDEEIKKQIKEILSITFNSKYTTEEKEDRLLDYQFMSKINGSETISGSLFLKEYLKQIERREIVVDHINDLKIIPFRENDLMVFVYIKDATIANQKTDIMCSYWLKANKEEPFRVYYPWITIKKDLFEYFKKVTSSENNGNIISPEYKRISFNKENPKEDVSKEKIYQDNLESVVQITAMQKNGVSSYASGFFIRKGVIVTSWQNFEKYLTNGNFVFINDAYGKTYNVLGVISINPKYDIAVLKISEEVGKPVILENSKMLKANESLYIINSINNGNFSIKEGTYLSEENGKIKNLFPLMNSDVGAALFNKNGHVIGFTTSDSLYKELSLANSSNYIKSLQDLLKNENYSNIKYTLLETFKETYYITYNKEEKTNNVPNDIWKKYNKIGNIKDNIPLELIKSNYKDEILTLRYIKGVLDTEYLITPYTKELEKENYDLKYEDKFKKVYQNSKYKVIIKSFFDYILIIIMEA